MPHRDKNKPQPRMIIADQPVVETPKPLPRGLKFYFTAMEWRLLVGLETNAKAPGWLRFDFYLGLGPILARLSL